MIATRRPTIRDVARLAGVSHMTVSRVINGDRAVREQTRARVEHAIEALHFSPNPAARALSAAEPTRVALLHRFPNMGSLGEYIVCLLQASTRMHVSLTVHEVLRPEDDAGAVEELVAERVRGVILAPPLGDDRRLVDLLRDAGMTIVATGATHAWVSLCNVGIDDRQAAKRMTEHLLGLGHRRIGFIKGRDAHASSAFRLEGYLQALAEAGLPCPEEMIEKGLYTYQSGLEAAERLLDQPEPPSAIFASNDDMAAATIAVAHRRGLDVPAQLSVCGFDDSPLATTIWPELTTVRQPTVELTGQALRLVLDAIAGHPDAAAPRAVLLDHALIVRASSGAPGGDAKASGTSAGHRDIE